MSNDTISKKLLTETRYGIGLRLHDCVANDARNIGIQNWSWCIEQGLIAFGEGSSARCKATKRN